MTKFDLGLRNCIWQQCRLALRGWVLNEDRERTWLNMLAKNDINNAQKGFNTRDIKEKEPN